MKSLSAVALLLTLATSAPAIVVTIQGTAYADTGLSESVNVPFTSITGVATTNTYHTLVLLIISEIGNVTPGSSGAIDAFYRADGTSAGDRQLSFHTPAQDPSDAAFNARNFIYYDVDANTEILARPYIPGFRPDHVYTIAVQTNFLISSPGVLNFGINDTAFGNNTGQFLIEIRQLEVTTLVPEPATAGLLLLACAGLAAHQVRRRRAANMLG